jgi:hypothetical protein
MAENTFADLDHDRARRTSIAEVILSTGAIFHFEIGQVDGK